MLNKINVSKRVKDSHVWADEVCAQASSIKVATLILVEELSNANLEHTDDMIFQATAVMDVMNITYSSRMLKDLLESGDYVEEVVDTLIERINNSVDVVNEALDKHKHLLVPDEEKPVIKPLHVTEADFESELKISAMLKRIEELSLHVSKLIDKMAFVAEDDNKTMDVKSVIYAKLTELKCNLATIPYDASNGKDLLYVAGTAYLIADRINDLNKLFIEHSDTITV